MRPLYVFVEGLNDVRFVDAILKPRIEAASCCFPVVTVQYSSKSSNYVRRYLDSIAAQGASLIFFRDLDNAPCISSRIDSFHSHFPFIDRDQILVVCKAIESWYVSGVDQIAGIPLNIKNFNKIDKQQFLQRIPKKYNGTALEFQLEILGNYSLDNAQGRNASLRYCLARLLKLCTY